MQPSPLLTLLHKSLGHATALLTSLGVFTAIDFTHQITLGSVILTMVIIAIAGVFTIRSKIAQVWREDAEGQKAAKERVEEELAREKTRRAEFDREQQELRHELKGQVAALTAQLKVMEAKTDLSAALDSIRQMNEHTVTAIVDSMKHGSELSEARDNRTHQILTEIRDKLPSEPIEVHPISE